MDKYFQGLEQREDENAFAYDNCDLVTELMFNSEADYEDSPYFNKIKSKENGIKVATGFDEYEFMFLFDIVEKDLTVLNKGKGRKCKLSAKERLLIVLMFLKHYDTTDRLGTVFGITSASCNQIITKTLKILKPTLIQNFLMPFKKSEQVLKGIRCALNPEVALIIDTTVFEIQKPTGLFEDIKFFFSGKHYVYCLKTEVAVLPNGLCAFVSDCYPGSKHDFAIFKERSHIYENFLSKEMRDHGLMEGDLYNMWAILGDKAYIGPGHNCRLISPPKKRSLTQEEIIKFKERSIVEQFFGRSKMLFKVLKSKFRGTKDLMNDITKICFALTNYHILNHPLVVKDLNFYILIKEKLAEKKKNSFCRDDDNVSRLSLDKGSQSYHKIYDNFNEKS